MMIRKLKARARVLHDGEIRASLTLEFAPAREYWMVQVLRCLIFLGKARRPREPRSRRRRR